MQNACDSRKNMKNIMEQILTGKLNNLETYLLEIDKYLDEENKIELLKILKNIKINKLYHSQIHGLFHSEKVTLFAFLIAKHLNLNPVDFQIIMDAAMYHDIKRQNDLEDKKKAFTDYAKDKGTTVSALLRLYIEECINNANKNN